MIKGKRILAGFVLALLVAGAVSGAAAFAEEDADETAQQNEAPAEDAGLELLEDAGEEAEALPPVEEPVETDPAEEEETLPLVEESVETDPADGGSGDREPRPRPVRTGKSGGGAAAAGMSASAQPEPEGQGTVEFDPESTAGACPGGTAMKIDNLRSNGTFGPVTISDFTNTSFTWTSTEAVSAVLVKDGGGYKTNLGGSSGAASSLGQDISHVIFCLGGEVPEVDPEAPCDADETTPDTEPCEPEPCDADETTPETEPCEPEPCDADDTTPETEPCEPEPCDGDDTMPGTQPCVPAACDADAAKPGRQDCGKGVGGVQSDPKKSEDDDVQGAGLAADSEPDGAAVAAQPMAAQPVAQGTILPFTGSPLVAFVMIAFGLVTAGGGAVLFRRP